MARIGPDRERKRIESRLNVPVRDSRHPSITDTRLWLMDYESKTVTLCRGGLKRGRNGNRGERIG